MRFLLVVCLLLVLLCPCTSEDYEPSPDTIITITTANGETKEISYAEFKTLEATQRTIQEKIMNEKDAKWSKQQRLEELEKKDPILAQQIRIASTSFQDLQRHGYALGYMLVSYTELDKKQVSIKSEYYITMKLETEIDPQSKIKPNTGLKATKTDPEPSKISFECEILVDQNEQSHLVSAWVLQKNQNRGRKLSIRPSEEYLAREKQQRPWYYTGILVLGISLIVGGIAILFLVPTPQPLSPTPTSPKKTEMKKKQKERNKWKLENKNK